MRSTVFPFAISWHGFSVTERNFLISSAWVIGLVGMSQLFFWGGGYLLHQDLSIGFTAQLGASTEGAMRYVTLPHYVIGFLFMATAARNRTVGRRALIVGLLVLSGLLCLGYAFLGTAFPNEMISSKTMRFYMSETRASPLAIFAIFLYFLVHELRDQAMFYVTTNSSGPIADRPLFDRFVYWLIGLSIGTFATIVWSLLVLGRLKHFYPPILPELTGGLRSVIALAPTAVCVLALGVLMHWYAHATRQKIKDMVEQHRPLMRVFAGVYLWLTLGLVLRSGPCLMILFHVVGWYVFTCYKLKERGRASPAIDWFTWMRTNLSGFRILHIGLILILIAIGAVWTFVFEGQGPLWYVLSPAAFYYWTIAHITTSFVPR